ncbi:large ribosomal subunit protein mL63-like [Argopecten irradians]|uniref:large ribosomal subunit protein mL63-like n=1 Tax=Argopecten irradians TaxID=31199 RepID=UPI00371D6EF3
MRLTCVLGYFKRYKSLGGQPFAGKYKVIRRVENTHKKTAVKNILQNARNMEMLNKPYITQEEEHGSAKALREAGYREEWLTKIKKQNEVKWLEKRPHYSIESHLEQLNISKKWE